MSRDSSHDAGHSGRSRTSVTAIALVGGDAAAHDEITAVLARIPEPLVEVVDLTAGNGDARQRLPEIVIVTLGDDEETWALQIQEIRQVVAHGAVIGALSSGASGKVRQALRAGAADVFFLPVEPSDLSRCLVRACETLQGGGARSATICSIASVAGGVGVSSLAVALGFALHRQDARRVALVDLGLQCGTLAAMLDLTPEFTISELVDPTRKIDSLRLESSLVAHKSGLYLLAAPKRLEESEMVSVDTVGAVLEVMRELFDFILIDCGHHMSEALIAAWEQSTYLLYVVEQSVASVRAAQRFLEMFERLQLTELDLQFVLNRYDPASPFAEMKIAAALHRPLVARIPRDDAAFLQFQLECADLARLAPRSPSRLAIDELAAHLSGSADASATAEAQPFLARMRALLKPPGSNLLNPLASRSWRRAVKPSAADV
jgi:pilus assembly protein CpaE